MRFKKGFFAVAVLLSVILSSAPVAAQDGGGFNAIDRLPAETDFFLHWDGLTSVNEHDATNPVLRLLNSGDLAALINAFKDYQDRLDEIRAEIDGEEKSESSSDDPTEDWAMVRRVMQNEGLVAAIPIVTVNSKTGKPVPEEAMLMLYDTTGNEDLIKKFYEDRSTKSAEVKEYDFAGVTVTEYVTRVEAAIPNDDGEGEVDMDEPDSPPAEEKNEEPDRYFRARVGKWLVAGDDKETTEQFILAVQNAPKTSITHSPRYQSARAMLGGESNLELYVDLASLVGRLAEATAEDKSLPFDSDKAFDASGVTRWESIFMGATVASDRISITGGLLVRSVDDDGDDIFGPPVATFGASALAPNDALSFAVMQLNIGALVKSIDSMIMEAAPAEQKPMIMGAKGAAMGMMGMSVEDFAAAWGYEHAQIEILDDNGEARSLHATSLNNRDGLVEAIRNLLAATGEGGPVGELPPSDETDDANTFAFYDSSAPPGPDGEPGISVLASFRPDWMLVASLKDSFTRFDEKPSGSTLRDNPNYQRARASMADELVALSYMDARRWIEAGILDKALNKILSQAFESATDHARMSADEETPEVSIPSPPVLMFPRGYLNFSYGSWNRDAKGIFFSGTIE